MNNPSEERPEMRGRLVPATRRTIVKGAAWSLPVIAASVATPAYAASQPTEPVCGGCFSWDSTHQNLGKPPADTWVTGPIGNGGSPATFGTVLVGYYSLKYSCTVPDDVRYIQYLVTYDSSIQSAASSTTVTTSDGGTVQPLYTPGGAVTIPGAGGAAVAGVVFGPNSGAVESQNVSALGFAVLYAGNIGWSADPEDGTTGPSELHHITGASFNANVQFTTVYMDGTFNTSSCMVPVNLQMTSPYPGSAASPSTWPYWYAGELTGTVG